MIQYEIVDKPNNFQSWGKWQKLFKPVPFDKAVLFRHPSKSEARRQGCSIQNSLRQNRETDYSIHFRVVPDDSEWLLYVWKEEKEVTK